MPRILLIILFTTLVLAVADLLVITASIALLIFAGILFGVFLRGINHWITQRTPLGYRAAHGIVICVILLLIVASSYYMGSQIVNQAMQLSEQLQRAGEGILGHVMERMSQADGAPVEQAVSTGMQALSSMSLAFTWVTWAITGAVVIFFVGVYVAFDPDLYTTGIIKLIPFKHRARADEIITRLRPALEKWLIGRMFSMAIVGVCTTIGLWLLGVPLAIPLGVLSAFLTFVPNIGAVVAVVPQALMAWQVSSSTVAFVIVFNVLLQAVESYLITPLIERHQVHLPPALTISMQLLLGATLGVIGVMMAAPLTVAVMLVIQLLYIRDTLGDAPGELAEDSQASA